MRQTLMTSGACSRGLQLQNCHGVSPGSPGTNLSRGEPSTNDAVSTLRAVITVRSAAAVPSCQVMQRLPRFCQLITADAPCHQHLAPNR